MKDRICILFVTHQCNLNCVYCYEKFKNKKHMDRKTLRHILSGEIEAFRERNSGGSLNIDFMGGEPMLNFELIREASEWLWREYPDAPYRLEMRTNGTRLTPESVEWLNLNKERIHVGLSLDGPEDLQNLNRSGSSGRIPVDFFINNWPDFPISATISPEGVGFVAKAAIYFHERQIPFRLTIAGGIDWSNEAERRFSAQLSILVDYYLAHPDVTPNSSLFAKDLCELREYIGPIVHTLCGKQGETIAYTAEGKPCICHLFTDITMGAQRFEQYQRLEDLPETYPADPACVLCPARPLCKVCPGFNILTTGSFHTQDKRACKMKFSILRANCSLYIQQHMQKALAGELTEKEHRNMTWALEHIEAQSAY